MLWIILLISKPEPRIKEILCENSKLQDAMVITIDTGLAVAYGLLCLMNCSISRNDPVA